MAIYGLHTGHDAASAKIIGNELIYSHELEKFDEYRYSYIKTSKHIDYLFPGVFDTSKDKLIVSGEEKFGTVEIDGQNFYYDSIGYSSGIEDPFSLKHSALDISTKVYPIETVYHTTCHVVGSYCCSPFAKRGEDSFVSMWDGGVDAMIFYVNYKDLSVKLLEKAVAYNGNVFSYISLYWGPLKLPSAASGNLTNFEKEMKARLDRTKPDHLNWRGAPGILMAYQGLGEINTDIVKILEGTMFDPGQHFPKSWNYKKLYNNLRDFKDEDIVATMYGYLGKVKMDNLSRVVRMHKDKTPNMILTGGCALNIKWNSYLRNLGSCKEVWAPPFPNDCGIALGAATTKMVIDNKSWNFDWDIYRGQQLEIDNFRNYPGWKRRFCSLVDLAHLLYNEDEPVVFLHGRAELGPRALGHRSILASPINESMRDRLNEIKGRASYRPVAPICMEEHAPKFFTPGTPDPYMLFDHQVIDDVESLIPAVIHVDGTARLQTVNHHQESDIYNLLKYFYQLSGIPMLCNTSANDKGKGFFPSIASAINWGRTKYIWAEDFIYEKVE